jgi:hypothetical protein
MQRRIRLPDLGPDIGQRRLVLGLDRGQNRLVAFDQRGDRTVLAPPVDRPRLDM